MFKSGLETLSTWFNVGDDCELSCTITIVSCAARRVRCAVCHRACSHVCCARHVACRHRLENLTSPSAVGVKIIAFSNFARRNDVLTYRVLDICRNWMKWLKLVTLYFQLGDRNIQYGWLSWAEVRGVRLYDLCAWKALAPKKGYPIILVGDGRTDQEENSLFNFYGRN